MWQSLLSASTLLACWNHVEAYWGAHGDFLVGIKGTVFLDWALDAYPLELGGESQYDNNYTLTAACHDALGAYYGGIQNKTLWAGLMMEAEGVLPGGNDINWVGNYENCLRSKATGDEMYVPGLGVVTHDFDAKYCRATTGLQILWLPVTMGLCVPETCTELDVKHILAVANGSLSFVRIYCGDNKEEYKDDARAITATVILVVFAAVILGATLLDYFMEWRKERCGAHDTRTGDQNLSIRGCGEVTTPVDENSVMRTTTTPTTTAASTDELQQLAGSVEEGRIEGETRRAQFTLADEDGHPQKQEAFGKLRRAVLAFSLRLNIRQVLSTSTPPGAYLAFNGVRFMSMTWIILGHTWYQGLHVTQFDDGLSLSAAANYFAQFLHKEPFSAQVINNMGLAVETFFLLSSCLVTISFMKQLDRQDGRLTVRQIALYYFHRYWRLTPVYAIVIMVFTAFTYHWISGPFATETLSEVENCKSNWWANLLYIQNFYKPKEMCISWSWYLALDFQYYCVVPFFAFIIYKKVIAGSIILFLAYFGSLTARVVISSLEYDWWLDMYVRPWCRFGPYAIGMALGVIMYRTKCKVKLPLVAVIVGWLVAMALCLLTVYGSYHRGDCHACSPWTGRLWVAYNSTRQHAFALGIAWLMFACSTGYGGPFNTFLSWSVFVPLSKLTYIGYLLHPIIIYQNYYNQQRGVYVDPLNMTVHFCFHLLMTLLIGFGFTLAFEVPMRELEKVVIPPKQKKQ